MKTPTHLWIAPALAVTALLTACGVLPRVDAVPPSLTERANIPGIPNARLRFDGDLGPFIQVILRDLQREIAALETAGKPTDPLPPVYLLGISGGGDAGAFAAGVLSGWTAHGDRPQFSVVTGTSAGALIAPFAFLGPEYDHVVRTVATSVGPDDIFRKRGTLKGLTSDGMASSEPLARLVAKYVTPDILAAIARECAKGRALQIATTDLDSGRPVTWNMGEIASSNAPGALELFRKIMVASTSIPGVVSPVMIDVEVDGKPFQEMHVDGAVISQVFLYPSTALSELNKTTGTPFSREIRSYVIRNGRLEPDWRNTKRRTLDIGGRAIRSLVQMQGINDVQRLFQTAQQDRAKFNVAYIGPDFDFPHTEEFDTAYMRSLYEYGYQLSATGRAWHSTPPDRTRMGNPTSNPPALAVEPF